MERGLRATLTAFGIFLAGIGLAVLAYPQLAGFLPDERLLAGCLLLYLVLLRLLGRAVAQRLLRGP